MRKLDSKNAIVTGARTGIGKAIVEKLITEGCNVWAVVHREDDDFVKGITQLADDNGVWVKIVNIDLENEESIRDGIQSIVSQKISIDVVVNAAGLTSPSRLIPMTSLKDIHRVMQVNFFAPVQICQMISKVMLRQKHGSIINISSIAGINGDLSQLEYSSSKAALICATKKMAYEWGPFNIRVNAIAPALIDTKMFDELDNRVMSELIQKTSLRRKGTPEEVACLCAFLACDDSSFISSQTIVIDGGGTSFVSTFKR